MKTNLEKIRSLDSDGLAYFLTDVQSDDLPWCKDSECCDGDCFKCCEKWLYKEANNDDFD